MALAWESLDVDDGQDDAEPPEIRKGLADFDTYAAWITGYDPGPTLVERLHAWRPAWHADAACRDMDVALFFPAAGEPADAALAICATCPVRDACADYGKRETAGVWGGRAIPVPRRRRARRSRRPDGT